MTTEERLNKIETTLKEHDDKIECLEKKQLTDKFELSNLITDAVNKGVQPLMVKLEAQDRRITILENAEAQKALKNSREVWGTVTKIIITIIITFFTTLVINNLISIANDNIQNKEMVVKK